MKKLILYLIAIIGGLIAGNAVGILVAVAFLMEEHALVFLYIGAGLGSIAVPVLCKDIIAKMTKKE
jgi:hypothetical protein